MIAVESYERLHTLRELVGLVEVEFAARERGDHAVATDAARRARQVVSVLGFDPIRYDPGRDDPARIIGARTLLLLQAMPGTSAQLSKAAGIRSNSVRQYLLPYLYAGEVTCRKQRPGGMLWEVVK